MYHGLCECIEYLRSFTLWTAAVSAPPAAVVSSPTKVSSTAVTGLAKRHHFTRKDFLNTLRNRLFAIDEQLWLHEYARANPKGKIDPLTDEEVAALQDLRQEITRDLPIYNLLEEQVFAYDEGNTPEVQRLQQKIDDLRRQLHCPLQHLNQIVVSSASGKVLSLMRGNGAAYQRLLPPASTKDVPPSYTRQLQHATFSSDHQYVGVVDLLFPRDTTTGSAPAAAAASLPSRASALVYQVTTDPQTYGSTESLPYFDSGPLPGAPFFVRFSPDNQHLVFLSTPYPPPKKPHGVAALFSASYRGHENDGDEKRRLKEEEEAEAEREGEAEGSTALMLLEWTKYRVLPPMRNQQRRWVPSTLAGTKTRTLLRGDAIYFTYTTASAANATIVAHVYERRTPTTLPRSSGVWMLRRASSGTADATDWEWVKIGGDPAPRSTAAAVYTSTVPPPPPPSSSSVVTASFPTSSVSADEKTHDAAAVTWFTPQCHSAGGGDNVVFVEGNALVTRALSPWKRRQRSSSVSTTKTLLTLAPDSVCHFLVAPDHSKMAVLDVHPTTQRRRLRILLGEELLDPLHPAAVVHETNVVEIPVDASTGLEPAACWFSPDGAQLLVYSTAPAARISTVAVDAAEDGDDSSNDSDGDSDGDGDGDGDDVEEASLGVYHLPTRQFHADVVRFHPTRYFRATYVSFFTQYAQVYNPWAPDSKSFLYHTSSGVHHWPLHHDRTRASPVGMDAWLHQGAAFSTWSRQ